MVCRTKVTEYLPSSKTNLDESNRYRKPFKNRIGYQLSTIGKEKTGKIKNHTDDIKNIQKIIEKNINDYENIKNYNDDNSKKKQKDITQNLYLNIKNLLNKKDELLKTLERIHKIIYNGDKKIGYKVNGIPEEVDKEKIKKLKNLTFENLKEINESFEEWLDNVTKFYYKENPLVNKFIEDSSHDDSTENDSSENDSSENDSSEDESNKTINIVTRDSSSKTN